MTMTPLSTTHVDRIIKIKETADINGPEIHQLLSTSDLDKVLAQELNALSLQTRNEIQEEIHCAQSFDVEETPELIEKSLRQMRLGIQNVPEKECVSYIDAVRNGWKYVQGDSYLLRFLRAERFQILAAIKRFLSHINFLQDIYGDFALQRPLRISDFSKEEQDILKSGRCTILPTRDRAGRLCFFSLNTGKDGSSNLQRARLWNYMMCVLSEDDETQKKGYVTISAMEQESFAYLSQDHQYFQAILEAIPVRHAAVHLCLPEGPMYKVLQILCMLIISGTEQRVRARYHKGIGIETRYELMGYGIPAEDIPLSSSMTLKAKNQHIWIRNRVAVDKAREFGVHVNFVEHPGIHDVLFRMGGASKCKGNSSFRQMMDDVLPSYVSPPSTSTQQEWRRMIREQLIDSVKQKGGRFLGWKKGKWMKLDDVEANEKISNAIYHFNKRTNVKPLYHGTLRKHSGSMMDMGKRRKLEEEKLSNCVCWKD